MYNFNTLIIKYEDTTNKCSSYNKYNIIYPPLIFSLTTWKYYTVVQCTKVTAATRRKLPYVQYRNTPPMYNLTACDYYIVTMRVQYVPNANRSARCAPRRTVLPEVALSARSQTYP